MNEGVPKACCRAGEAGWAGYILESGMEGSGLGNPGEYGAGVRLVNLGVILADSLATDSSKASCCKRLAETGTSVAIGRVR